MMLCPPSHAVGEKQLPVLIHSMSHLTALLYDLRHRGVGIEFTRYVCLPALSSCGGTSKSAG
jgi:hypothetical protein